MIQARREYNSLYPFLRVSHYAVEVITKGDLTDISLKYMDEIYYSFTVRKNKDQLSYLQPQSRLSGNDNTEKTVNQVDFSLSYEPY